MTHVTYRLTTKNRDQLGTLRSAIEYWLPLLFLLLIIYVISEKKQSVTHFPHATWKCTTLTCEVPNFLSDWRFACTCIFRTCVFHPCRFVLAFSVHAFSILAKCAVSYLPFPYLRFPVLAFSAPPPFLLPNQKRQSTEGQSKQQNLKPSLLSFMKVSEFYQQHSCGFSKQQNLHKCHW